MSYPKSVVKAVEDYCKKVGSDLYLHIDELANIANFDLYNGPSEHDDEWPGFESACRQINDWLSEIGTLYVEEDSGCVSTTEPQDEDLSCEDVGCEGCDTEHWREPMPFYELDRKAIASILFGNELAQYL